MGLANNIKILIILILASVGVMLGFGIVKAAPQAFFPIQGGTGTGTGPTSMPTPGRSSRLKTPSFSTTLAWEVLMI